MTMLERAARALLAKVEAEGGMLNCMEATRVVLTAIREPDEAMQNAVLTNPEDNVARAQFRAIWGSGIDAILAGGK